MPEKDSDLLKLIKSVLIPVDAGALIGALRHLREEAENTSWLQLLYRLEGISVLILIPSTLILGFLLAYKHDISLAKVQTIGIQYTVGLFLVSLILIAKVVIWLVNRINNGQSVWNTRQSGLNIFVVLKTVGSSLFIVAPTYLIMQLELALETLVTLFILSFIVLFSIIAGVSGVFSTIILLQNYFSQ